jgi:uncharacterized membrane protein
LTITVPPKSLAFGKSVSAAAWLVLTLVVAYTALFTSLAIARHDAHRTSVFDLGVYDQAIWSTAEGRPLIYTAEPGFGNNFLATHLQPILILLAPLYWLGGDVRLLFVVQTLALALGALPVFWLARWKAGSTAAGVLMSMVYLLLPALEAANLFDFHPETFAPALWLSLFCLLETILPLAGDDAGPLAISRSRAAILFFPVLLLTLSVKEDMALMVAMMGLYVIVLRRQWRLGLCIMTIAAVWFMAGVYVVMPYFHRGELSPFLSYYASLGSTPQQIVWNAIANPALTASLLLTRENGIALLAFMLPLAFAPLLELPVFLIAAPALVLNALSENPLMHLMEDKHYAAPIIPFALLASIYALGRLRSLAARRGVHPVRAVRAAVVLIVAASLTYHYFRGFTPLSRMFEVAPVTAHDRLASTFEARIPSDASLVAQDRLYPHLAHRAQISYQFPQQDSTFPAQDGADYIFLDIAHLSFVNADNIHTWLRQQLATRTDYGLIQSRDGYILLKRGAPHADLSPDFYTFANGSEAVIAHPLHARFGGELELVGFNYAATRDQELTLELFWRTVKDTIPDRLPNLYLLDASGKSLAETRFPQPTLVWYPTSQWHTGQLIRVVFNTLTWSTDELDTYTLALSVLDQPDPRNARRALIVQALDDQSADRVLHNSSMLRLGDFKRQFGYTWLVR